MRVKRVSRRTRTSTDEELILEFMHGRACRADLEARNPFMPIAMSVAYTEYGRLARKLWQEHGESLLKVHKGKKLPDQLKFMISACRGVA